MLEIIGGGLERFCLYDEVTYLDKALKTMPDILSNDPMTVMRVNEVVLEKHVASTSVTLFDKADQKFIEVPHC